MYNGHCINPHRSFKTKSPSKVFTHVHLNQAALYKARHEFQYRCWASNENFNAPAYSVCLRGLLSCPVITLSFPILTLMKLIWITPIKSSNNHRWFQGLQSEGWAEPPTPPKKQTKKNRQAMGWTRCAQGHGFKKTKHGIMWHKYLFYDRVGGWDWASSASFAFVVDKPLADQVPAKTDYYSIITIHFYALNWRLHTQYETIIQKYPTRAKSLNNVFNLLY